MFWFLDFQQTIHVRKWIFKCHMIHATCSSWPFYVCPAIERYSTKLRWTPGSASPISSPIFILGLLGGIAVAPVLVIMAFIMALLPMFGPWLAVLLVPVPGAHTWVGWRVSVPHLLLSPAVLIVLKCQTRWQSYSKPVCDREICIEQVRLDSLIGVCSKNQVHLNRWEKQIFRWQERSYSIIQVNYYCCFLVLVCVHVCVNVCVWEPIC